MRWWRALRLSKKNHVRRKPYVPNTKRQLGYLNLRFVLMSLGMCAIFFYLNTLKDSPLYQTSLHSDIKEVKESSFDELYTTYVDAQTQERCREKGFTCKAFYVALSLVKREPQQAIEYLQFAYENNISSLIDDPEAKDNYLFSHLANASVIAGDFQKAITWYERSIEAGERRNVCYLGRVYRDIQELEKAYTLFEEGHREHFSECTLDLGTFYFNGIHVRADRNKGGALWMEAYKDDIFGADINFNMAVYHANVTKDLDRYKYHLLKSALAGDSEAQSYLAQPKLQERNVASLFVNEAISEGIYPTAEVRGKKFSYGFDLYYRFVTFFNQEKRWIEVYDAKKSESVVFKQEEMMLTFGLKALQLDSSTQVKESFFNEMHTLVDTLYIDTPTALHVKLSTVKEMLKKAIEQEKKLDATTPIDTQMSWQITYAPDVKRLYFAIVLK